MRQTRAVNIKHEDCDVYVGRRMPGWPDGTWGNPYKVGRDGTRENVIAKYRAYILRRPDLLARLPELRGKRLGCWCKPRACHADVLAELAESQKEVTA